MDRTRGVVHHARGCGEGLAMRAADEKAELIIVAGGDGTIHAVATSLIARESNLALFLWAHEQSAIAWEFPCQLKPPVPLLLKEKHEL